MHNPNKSKLVVKVYCLPRMSQKKLKELHGAIVAVAKGIKAFNIESEDGLIVLFPADLMKYGLGREILIELDIPQHPDNGNALLELSSEKFGSAVLKFFPKAFVQCSPYRFNPALTWTAAPPPWFPGMG